MSLYAHIFDDMPARPEFPVEIPDPILIQEWIDQETTRLMASCADSGDFCHCGLHVLPFLGSSRERVRA